MGEYLPLHIRHLPYDGSNHIHCRDFIISDSTPLLPTRWPITAEGEFHTVVPSMGAGEAAEASLMTSYQTLTSVEDSISSTRGQTS